MLHKSRPSCEILQDHAAEPLGDGLYGGFKPQVRQQTPEHCLNVTGFLPRRVGSLVQYRWRYLFPFAQRLL